MIEFIKRIKWNAPNVLSVVRIGFFPILLCFAYFKLSTPFTVLFCIGLVTDILDGYIARKWNMQSAEGVLLDSTGDLLMYINALIGIAVFHPYMFKDHVLFNIYIGLFLAVTLFTLIKYKRFSDGLHLYSAKVTGYLQGFFFASLFSYGFIGLFFYPAMVVGSLSLIEGMIIIFMSPQPVLNAKSLWHFLKS